MIFRNQTILISCSLFLATLCSFKPSTSTHFRPNKDFALFFAVNNYDSWDKLKNPVSEAEAIAKELHDLYGFDTLVVRNPTKAQIQSKIEAYRARTYAKDAQLFIYFTGHGEYLESTKEGFFIPKEAKRDDDSQDSYLSYLRLQRWIETLPCNHILLCIDACFSGTFDEDIAMKGDIGVRPGAGDWREQYIRQTLEYKSRLFMASGGKVRTPDKSDFARQLLAGLRSFGGDDKLISFPELWGYVKRAAPKPCAATFGDHAAGGDFLFVLQNDQNPNTELDDWNTAKRLNTIVAYENYLKKHPQGDFAEAATAKMEALRNVKPDNMVLIPGGTFEMGSEDGLKMENPIHRVTLSDFYFSKYEVTVAEFRAFVEASGYQTDAEKEGKSWGYNGKELCDIEGRNWRHDPEGNLAQDNHPVINVSWNDATEYCKWLSQRTGLKYRLPTEAEWEYAAGNGARHTKYSWGNSTPSGKRGGNVADEAGDAHFNWRKSDANIFVSYNDGFATTAPIGSYDSNNFGLFDMTGNVWEWCNDWYGDYPSESQNNPVGPSTGFFRVARGGGWWFSGPKDCRVASRGRNSPGYCYFSMGFRPARTK
ncbi:MAG: SUMF1/EgtB/PvdO family nonheme iron enzyme [Bacteroidota bacterium]